jgi:hypothetical protein
MKIAVCLAGQPRCWEKSDRWWESCFSHYTDNVDVFYHFWNYKTVPKSADFNDNSKIIVSDEEFEKMNLIYRPKKYTIDKSELDVPKLMQDFTNQMKHSLPNPFLQIETQSVAHAISYQYYSWMKVAQLKRQYEIENNFEYDVCIHGRSDLSWKNNKSPFIHNKLSKLPRPKNNNLYTVHNTYEHPYPGIGDVFWYADSLTFDIASNFFRGLRYILDSMFYTKLTPEKAFLYYAKMVNLNIYTLEPDLIPLTMRDQEYVDKYGLQHYEAV